jgi:hypothetical protein
MKKSILITVLLFCLFLSIAQAQKQNPAAQQQVELAERLIGATKDYKTSLEKVLNFAQLDITKATENVEKYKKLFAEGIISRRMLEESEQVLKDAQTHYDAINRQLSEADLMIAEAEAAKQLANEPAPDLIARQGSGLIRYHGNVGWVLQESSKIDQFFRDSFGRALPISAYGQTQVHNRLGYDHHNALDVAVSPESPEGQALMRYLRNAGIPFLAFSRAIPGTATGPHIHIGRPSLRIVAQPPSS